MAVSIESCFAVNFLMDAWILCLSARGHAHLRPWRIALAASICATYAVWCAASGSGLLASPPCMAVVLLLGILCAGGPMRPLECLKSLARAFVCALLLGGAQLAARRLCHNRPQAAMLLGAALGGLVLCLLLSQREKSVSGGEVEVWLGDGVKETRISAIVDTGNRLREPISALPVLIVSSEALPRNFGSGLRCRSVRYGALGGGGTMRCYQPDSVWIVAGGARVPSPDIWVAVYPGAMPGRVQALAPACMAVRKAI